MSQPHLIWTRHFEKTEGCWKRHGYTAQEVYDQGFRDGRDGIKYYPCSHWDREGLADPNVYGNRSNADYIYHHGYTEGRLHWRAATGSFPSTGDASFDEVLIEQE